MSIYLQKVANLLQVLEEQEQQAIEQAANIIYQSIEQGGILQLFGCGHSQLIAQEAYYRAGGLVPAKAVCIEPLMLHKGAAISSENEKDLSHIEEYWSHFEFQSHDVLIVISTSGKNAVPIEIALRAKEKGIPVITLQSFAYCEQSSKYPTKKRLETYADVVLNTHVPLGDGIMEQNGLRYGPVSTLAGVTLLNEVIVRVVQLFHDDKKTFPIFVSNNVEQEGNTNAFYMKQYEHRINF